MATHSSILAWKTPWAEEPGGLQSELLPRVRHTTERLSTQTLKREHETEAHFFFCTMYLKPGVYFTLTAYCSLDAKFPSEVFDLDFIRFTIGKVESYN